MTTFIRLLDVQEKSVALQEGVKSVRLGTSSQNVFDVCPISFSQIPGSPFAYWVSEGVRRLFTTTPQFENEDRMARAGLQSSDDFRFLRTNWETPTQTAKWVHFAKGGKHSPIYADIYMKVNWKSNGGEIKAWASSLYNGGHWSRNIRNVDLYFRTGIFQTLRADKLAPHVTPPGCIFSDNGTQAFCDIENVLPIVAILNSRGADLLHKLLLGRSGYALYRNGTLARLPLPNFLARRATLAEYSKTAWTLRRRIDSVEETSHAFLLPSALRPRLGDYDPDASDAQLMRIQDAIDAISFEIYDFSEADRTAALHATSAISSEFDEHEDALETDAEELDGVVPVDHGDGLKSWAVGVAFGRFDWRLATGERSAPPEPGPFDPLPAKSPSMLPDGSNPFHTQAGILVDDPGQNHDLASLTEEVLARVDVPVPSDVRRWLQREFFPFHLQRYSKSRRKAPIYWPLATASGGYTLWLYYPDLDRQTLYTAVNEFVEPKLEQVGKELDALRNKGSARSRDDDKVMEALQTLEKELVGLRDTLLQIAPTYRPNHDDGVQITAAPLWSLFRHKPWQKLLKDTWAKLENGDYDWSHLAMAYWSDRVREKCKTDQSLAIAHGLDELYEPPPKSANGLGRGGRKRQGAAL